MKIIIIYKYILKFIIFTPMPFRYKDITCKFAIPSIIKADRGQTYFFTLHHGMYLYNVVDQWSDPNRTLTYKTKYLTSIWPSLSRQDSKFKTGILFDSASVLFTGQLRYRIEWVSRVVIGGRWHFVTDHHLTYVHWNWPPHSYLCYMPDKPFVC